MSVYSGFATRQQQTKYNNLIQNLIIAFKRRIIKFYKQDLCDQQKFTLLIKKIYKKMLTLQKNKFVTPKYSTSLIDLLDILNIDIDYDSFSDVSSSMSRTFTSKKPTLQLENQLGKNKNILENKKLYMETQIKLGYLSPINLCISTPNNKNNRIDGQLLHQFDQKTNIIQPSIKKNHQSTHIDFRIGKSKIKINDKQNLKQLNYTMTSPKIQDFIPKKQELPITYFPHEQRQLPREVKAYRRQRFSKSQMEKEKQFT